MIDRPARGRVPALLVALVVLISVFVVPSAFGEENAATTDADQASSQDGAAAEEPAEEATEEPAEEATEEPAEEATEEPAEEEPAEEPTEEAPDDTATDDTATDDPAEQPVEESGSNAGRTSAAEDAASATTSVANNVSKPKAGGGGGGGGGNTGTVKVDGENIDAGGGNEPHTDCIFQLDFYGFKAGDDATYTFSLKSPTGSGTLTSDTVPFGPPNGKGLNASTGDIDLGQYIWANGASPNSKGEYHVDLLVNTPDGTKSKTYWAKGCVGDVGIEKTDSTDPVMVGDAFSYTLTVTNAGPTDARNVSVSDTLPTEVDEDTNNAATADTGTISITGDVVTWNIGTMASGDTATATIYVIAKKAGTASNTADVSTTTFDPDTSNNSDTETTVINAPAGPTADLEVDKADTADPVKVGDGFAYTISVTNNGPDTAADVQVTDTLPVEVDADTSQTNTKTKGTLAVLSDVVTWDIGSMAPGDTETATIYVIAKTAGTASNTAEATTTTTEADLTNNSDTEPTTINDREADLSITKTDSADPVLVGDNFDYNLSVTNDGPDKAEAVQVTDTLPSEVEYVSSTASVGTISENNGVITWDIGDMASGDTATATITVKALKKGDDVLNAADVTSQTNDPDPSDNRDEEETDIHKPVGPNLGRIVLAVKTEPQASGQPFDFSGIFNTTLAHGQTESMDVLAGSYTVTEEMPDGWELVSLGCNDNDSTVDENGLEVTFEVAAGETVKCTYVNTEIEVLPEPPFKKPHKKHPNDPGDPARRQPTVLSRRLPFTGSELMTYMWLASLLMTLGVGAYFAARRQEEDAPEESLE